MRKRVHFFFAQKRNAIVDARRAGLSGMIHSELSIQKRQTDRLDRRKLIAREHVWSPNTLKISPAELFELIADRVTQTLRTSM